jgi:hypothetical protein
MASIQCTVDIPNVSGLEDNQLTVGREFYLTCKGEWPKTLKQESLTFVGDENLKYQMKLVGFEFRSPEEADIKVTSYVAAKYQFPQLVLTDGEQQVDLGPVQFAVQSVLPPQGAQEKVEPFGPFGPATIAVPVLYWLVLVGTLVLGGILVALKIWRTHQRREMLLRLKEHDAALSPLQEFHQSMRRLQRANPVFYGKEASPEELRQGVEELSRMFKVFVSRRLKVPAFEWNEHLIIKDIRRYHFFVYEEYSKKLHALFSEFHKAEGAKIDKAVGAKTDKAEGAKVKLSANDVVQLAESLRKTIEGIESLMNREPVIQKGNR